MLVNSALQSSGKTISDMYGDRGKYMNPAYKFQSYAENGLEFDKNCDSTTCTDWSKNIWYTSPTQTSMTSVNDPAYDEYRLCGYSQPFMGRSMNTTYANLHGPSKTFIGHKNGFYCIGPA